MSEYHIILPSKPRVVSETDKRGTYEIDGFYPGYGHTIGNSLRRIILSSLPGAAITHVKIDGVTHEFSTIEGVKEDVITLLLNLKKIRFNMLADEPVTISLEATGPKEVTAADFDIPGQLEIVNKDQVIAEISGKKKLSIECTVERGIGFIPKESIHKDRIEIGTIALDASFSPIRRVNYEVDNMRVGDRTDFNRLHIFIETDGTITPREALEKSVNIMIHQLQAIIGFKEETIDLSQPMVFPPESKMPSNKKNEDDTELLKMRTEDLGLPQRIFAVIDEAGIRTLGGLVRKREEDLLAIQGLGQKGVHEIKKALSDKGLALRQ
jgi:DNA-directed RNA polymerase subunit alpha